jgi:hypothetical protein
VGGAWPRDFWDSSFGNALSGSGTSSAGATDFDGLIRVLGVEDRHADSRIAGDVSCLAGCRGSSRTGWHRRLAGSRQQTTVVHRPGSVQRRNGREIPAIKRPSRRLVEGWSAELAHEECSLHTPKQLSGRQGPGTWWPSNSRPASHACGR